MFSWRSDVNWWTSSATSSPQDVRHRSFLRGRKASMVCAPVMVSMEPRPRENDTVLWVSSSRCPAILLLGLRRLLAKPCILPRCGGKKGRIVSASPSFVFLMTVASVWYSRGSGMALLLFGDEDHLRGIICKRRPVEVAEKLNDLKPAELQQVF